MAITHVGSLYGRSFGSNLNPLTMTLPAHATNDIGLLICCGDGSSGTVTFSIGTATGWARATGSPWNSVVGEARIVDVFYKVFTSASEVTPLVQTDVSEQHSCGLHVFRGVSTSNPFDANITEAEAVDTFNPTNASIVTATAGAAILVAHYPTDNDHSTGVTMQPPSGYTMGLSQINAIDENFASAYLLDAGAAGTKNPGAWTHTGGSAVTTDATVLTIALRDANAVVAGNDVLIPLWAQRNRRKRGFYL